MRKYLDNLLIYGGGIVGFIAFFKNDFPAFWEQLSNMSGRAVLLTLSALAVAVGLILKWREKRTTPSNIRVKLRDWLEEWQVTVRKITPPDVHFGWEVILPSGAIVWILRTNLRERYLTFLVSVDPQAQQTSAYAQLTEDQRLQFWRALVWETSRSKINFYNPARPNEITRLTIEKLLLITSRFGESDLVEVLRELDFSAHFLFNTVVFLLPGQPLPVLKSPETETPPAGEAIDSPKQPLQVPDKAASQN